MSRLRREYDEYCSTDKGNIVDMLMRAMRLIDSLNKNLVDERAYSARLLHEINSLRTQLEVLLKRESS